MKDSTLDLLGDAGTVEVAQPANGQDPKQQNVHATLHDNKAPKTSTNVGCAGGAFIQSLSARNICAHISQGWVGHVTRDVSLICGKYTQGRQGVRYKVSVQVMLQHMTKIVTVHIHNTLGPTLRPTIFHLLTDRAPRSAQQPRQSAISKYPTRMKGPNNTQAAWNRFVPLF